MTIQVTGASKPSGLPVLGYKRETPTVVTFMFARGDRAFQYRPGQHVSIRLENLEDPRGPIRPFTISSSPTEEGHITITTRLRGSPFKERLLLAEQGEEVDVRGPFGRFVLDETRPAVMLAGGIGITPFRSMVRYAVDKGLGQPIVLLYSSSHVEEIVFREELESYVNRLKSLRVVMTVTRPEESREVWRGKVGRLGASLILEETRNLSNPVYYVCGPPAMVEDMVNTLRQEMSVQQENIRIEKFEGY